MGRRSGFEGFLRATARAMAVAGGPGHDDVQDGTLHTNKKLITAVYDRRRVRKATPAG